jgi:hypothetical protein
MKLLRSVSLLLPLALLLPACPLDDVIATEPPDGGAGDGSSPDGDGATAGPEAGTRDTGMLEASEPTDGSLCSAATTKVLWASMDAQPIFLADPANTEHREVAGLDLDGPGNLGISPSTAESKLCNGSALGPGPNGTLIEGWGYENEVQFLYDPKMEILEGRRRKQIVQGARLFPGYTGTMRLNTDPKGSDSGHEFVVGVGAITKDGLPFEIDWTDPTFAAGNDLYNAIAYNSIDYAGFVTTPCTTSGACAVTVSGETRQFVMTVPEVTLDFSSSDDEPAASTVTEIELGVTLLGTKP